MYRETDTKTIKTGMVEFLPKVGDILSSQNLSLVPVNYSVVNDEQRWTTYAIFDEVTKEWYLSWAPYRGLAVFIHKKNFKELQNFAFVQKVKVVKVLKSSIVVESYE